MSHSALWHFEKHKFLLLIPFGDTTGVLSAIVSTGEESMTKCCVFVSTEQTQCGWQSENISVSMAFSLSHLIRETLLSLLEKPVIKLNLLTLSNNKEKSKSFEEKLKDFHLSKIIKSKWPQVTLFNTLTYINVSFLPLTYIIRIFFLDINIFLYFS